VKFQHRIYLSIDIRSVFRYLNVQYYKVDMAGTRRIPVSEPVWIMLCEMKKPGQTYDSLLKEIIDHEKNYRFIREMEKIKSHCDFEFLIPG